MNKIYYVDYKGGIFLKREYARDCGCGCDCNCNDDCELSALEIMILLTGFSLILGNYLSGDQCEIYGNCFTAIGAILIAFGSFKPPVELTR